MSTPRADVRRRRNAATPRQRWMRLCFAAAVLLTLGMGQELLFRAVFPLPEVAGFNRIRYQMMAGTSPNFRDALKRGLAYERLLFESRPDGYSEVHRLNRYGFRGPDFAVDPAPGTRRILLVGDSVAEGQGAPESGTIAAALGRRFAEEGRAVEVLNLGVVAATLPHTAALVRDAVPLLRPADVVVVLYANDLPAPVFARELDEPATGFPRRDASWWLPRVVELTVRAAQGEPLHRRWPHPATRFFPAVPDPQNPWSKSGGPPPGIDTAAYQAMTEGALNPWLVEQSLALPGMLSHDFQADGGSPSIYLTHMAEWCRSAGARMHVAYVPFCGTVGSRYAPTLVKLGMDPATAAALAVDPTYRRQSAELASVCGVLGVSLADATAALEAAEARSPQFWAFDTHPRPEGYTTIAAVIHAMLK